MLGLEGEGSRECRGGGEEQDGEGGGGDLLPKPWFLIANCLNMKVFYDVSLSYGKNHPYQKGKLSNPKTRCN